MHSNKKEILDVLLKEYDLMRAEVRMYINKQYLALTAILAILTAGVFKADPSTDGFVFIWIPFVVSGIISFIAMVSFFINKTAGYIRLIEERINRLYFTESPNESSTIDENSKLAPLFWESYYADIGMARDKGLQFKSIFGSPLLAMAAAGLITLIFVMKSGYVEIAKTNSVWAMIYLLASFAVLAGSAYSFWYVNTNVRKKVKEINKKLVCAHEPLNDNEDK